MSAVAPGETSKGAKRRSTWIVALLTVVSVVAAVGAGEILARAIDGPELSRQRPSSPVPDGLPIIRTIREQSRPNAEGIHRNAYFRNNSAGFRGPETSEQAAPGTFRIAIVGDSIALGSGVGNGESYPAVLSSVLRRRFPEHEIEVLNFGLGGINTRQVWQRASRYVPRYHPDLVVYGMTLDDLKGKHYVKRVEVNTWRAHQRQYLRFRESRSHLLRLVWPRVLSIGALVWPPEGSYVAEVHQNFFDNPEAWHEFEVSLTDLVELCWREGARMVAFTHTRLWYLNRFHPFRPMYEKYAAAAAERGVPVIHSLDALLGYHGHDLWVSPVDPHPGAAAHQILALALADGLEMLPEGYFPPADERNEH